MNVVRRTTRRAPTTATNYRTSDIKHKHNFGNAGDVWTCVLTMTSTCAEIGHSKYFHGDDRVSRDESAITWLPVLPTYILKYFCKSNNEEPNHTNTNHIPLVDVPDDSLEWDHILTSTFFTSCHQ
ncbi:hypothetical protein HELRODRAFT_160743 [Helobdella robusta]|uniref:Uncharacterized protein n=1 Tax=Helobdella robusta TaxID=6412 RepID=T1EQN6_HELRO|nr:hypothetical protein HELRODRAFT_160743 [Helobdella robusta]ESO06562.1 hypothetical protein HELRODRAFT_160743 [Helobdella robusta]